jgi:hypothetical protein
MRSEADTDRTVPAFTVACPGFRRDVRGREGVLAFTLDNQVAAEIGHADLLESWRAACALSVTEALRMSLQACRHLSGLIEQGMAAADLTEAVTDAAVVLLLAMKRAGVVRPERIPACTIMWNGQEECARVVLGA